MSLSGHDVLVTGAAGAVGSAVCGQIIDAGGKVIAVDNEIGRLEPTIASAV